MSRVCMAFLAAAFLLFAAMPDCAASDPAALRAQLALATTADDTLARIELLRRLVDADPSDSAAHRQLIELWLEISDYDLADATLKSWPDAPADLTALTRAAVLRFRDKDVPGAIRVLNAYHATAPSDVPALSALVAALLTTDDTAASLAALDALIALSPSPTAFIQRANVKFRRADYPGAIADAQAAQRLAPEADIVKESLPAFERLTEALQALPPLDAALAKNPRDLKALLARAVWLRYGGILDRSLNDANVALEIAPDSLAAKITRDRALFLLKKLKAEDARRDDLVDVTTAHALEDLIAIASCDLILAKNAEAESKLRQRAAALNAALQPLLAQRDAEAALVVSPNDAGAALEALDAAIRLDQDAAPILRRIEQMKPAPGVLARANGQLASLYLRQGKLPLALQFADQSLAFAETEDQLRVKSAALQRLGRPDEANAATRRADALRKK